MLSINIYYFSLPYDGVRPVMCNEIWLFVQNLALKLTWSSFKFTKSRKDNLCIPVISNFTNKSIINN